MAFVTSLSSIFSVSVVSCQKKKKKEHQIETENPDLKIIDEGRAQGR
jgi:hypothetical protein